MEENKKIRISKDGLGVNIRALYDGMEGLVRTKTVVGEPIRVDDVLIIPLIEVSAGLATGALQKNASESGAGAMNAKISPIALLIIEDGRTKLVSVKSQDVFVRLIDLIPEAIDKIKKGAVSEDAVNKAREILEESDIEIIEGDNQ